MIKRFFHNLNSAGVSYILISGQATVLYGAAAFSEDIDLWVEPCIKNWDKFIKLLNDIGARVYKLTPPISMELVKKGHGYHFRIPSKGDKPPLWFLDIMGVVPRAGDFKDSFRRIIYQKTDWGRLPVLGIRDLVEIKKTRRLEDYSVISNLVRIEYENLSKERVTFNDWKWILTNSFEAEDILYYIRKHNSAKHAVKSISRKCLIPCLKAVKNGKGRERYIESISKEIALEIEDLRKEDRRYWAPIISDLKIMNEKKQLLVFGSKPPKSVR